MLRFLGRLAIGTGLGGLLTLIAFGFGIVGLVLGTVEPVNPYETAGFFAAAIFFAFAGQWLIWLRYFLPGADSVAGGAFFMGIGAIFTALGFDVGQQQPWFLWIFSLPFLFGGAELLARGASTSRAGGAVGSLGRALGLTVSPLRWFKTPSARGAVKGMPVSVTARNARVSIEVAAPALLPELVVAAESVLALRKEQVQTGDAAFDRAVFLRGGVALLASLDAETRALVKDAVESGARVAGGALRHDRDLFFMGSHYRDGGSGTKELAASAERMAELARRLSVTGDVPARLARNAASDHDPDVRLRNLQALFAAFPASGEAAGACAAALRASDRAPRLLAALHALATRTSWAGALRDEALAALEEGHDPRAEALLIERIRSAETVRSLEPVLRALRSAGGSKAAEVLDALSWPEAAAVAKEIRTRLASEGGRLSLDAPGEAGRLSTTESEGALSEPSAPRPAVKTTR